jgi:serine/threonine-protein kinase HipA
LNKLLEQERPTNQLLSEEFEIAFSLAGLQDKFSCRYDLKNRKIYLTNGKEPSTHIVKLNLKWKNSRVVENEFFCLNLAQRVGLKTSQHLLENTNSPENPILILTRYDRFPEKKSKHVGRTHQEDFCQVFGTSLAQKYEHEGGRSFVDIYNKLKSTSSNPIADLDMLLNWLCFNFIIGNSDSHAKNISIIIEPKSVRLAPFYDLMSTTIYGNKFRTKFAFKIGGENECDKIRKRNIDVLESELQVRPGFIFRKFREMAERIEKKLPESTSTLLKLRPQSTIPERVGEVVQKRIKHVERFF